MLILPIVSLASLANAGESRAVRADLAAVTGQVAPVYDLTVDTAGDGVARGEDDEDEDSDEESSSRRSRSSDSEGQIREVVRGFFVKANIGAAGYLLAFATKGDGQHPAVDTGTLVGLSVGQDFVDNEKQSMAWEVALLQGVHNGLDWSLQSSYGCSYGAVYPCTEGDLRTYSLQASYEFSAYPSRRIGLGFRAGGGALYSPLLLEPTAYQSIITDDFGYDPLLHGSIHPYGFAGPTFEYYTKLSHFSVGVDVDVFYAVGWDLGYNGSASLKYTF
jgi:hypothetical protein